jgi:hypothetical protein
MCPFNRRECEKDQLDPFRFGHSRSYHGLPEAAWPALINVCQYATENRKYSPIVFPPTF